MITDSELENLGWVRNLRLPSLWCRPGFLYYQPDNNLMSVRGLDAPADRSDLVRLTTPETEDA